MIKSLRGRLIGWHLCILVVSLVLFSTLLYVFLSRSLYEHHDSELAVEAARLAKVFAGVDISQEGAAPGAVPPQVSEEFLIVRNLQGQLLYRSPLLEITEPNIGEHEALVHAATLGTESPQFFTAQLERTGPVRFICIPIDRPYGAYLQLGRPLGDVPETLRTVAIACAVLVPVILVLMSFSGWVIAGHALAPMKSIDAALQAIEATDLPRRLDVPADSELGGLVSTLNRLLARLEKAFSSLKQFTADVSHELQTPLTVIKGTADVTLASPRTADQYQLALTDIQEESDELTAILADLRALSLADAGPGAATHGAVNLSDLAREVADILEALAESKHIAGNATIESGVIVWGSNVGLKQVLLNLVDNAVKYTGAEGRVRLQLRAEAHEAVLTVSDSGIGIAPEDLPRVFDRFYRVPGLDARSRGTGLGLAIAKRIVEAHGGSITAESRVGEGSSFTVRLPLAR